MKLKYCLHTSSAVLFLALLVSCASSFPPTGTVIDCNGQYITPVLNPAQRPEYPGGKQAFQEYLSNNIQVPREAVEQNISGKVRAAFIISKAGKVCDIRITSKPLKYLDTEVIRVLEQMPIWNPGYHNGKIQDCYYLIDVEF